MAGPLEAAADRCGEPAGPDGNLWFTQNGANSISRITPSGVVTDFSVPTPGSAVTGITAGPDGNLWFTEGNGNNIGCITPAGVITEVPLTTPGSGPAGIALGSDDNLWFTHYQAPWLQGPVPNSIGRLSGIVEPSPAPSTVASPTITPPSGTLPRVGGLEVEVLLAVFVGVSAVGVAIARDKRRRTH